MSYQTDLLAWADERCGVFRTPPRMVWCGPYNDAAVLDQVLLCWLTDQAYVAVWHLARLQYATDPDDLIDRLAFAFAPAVRAAEGAVRAAEGA